MGFRLQLRNLRAKRWTHILCLALALLAWKGLLPWSGEHRAPRHVPPSFVGHGGEVVRASRDRHEKCDGVNPPHQAGYTAVPLGFTLKSYEAERRWEERYLALPDAARCGDYLRRLTARAHLAGTTGDRTVTAMIYDEFERDGLHPEIYEYKVLLSYPVNISVELVSPKRVRLANPEPVVRGDQDTSLSDPMMKMPWSAYSPSADLVAPVVYVNYGTAEDYDFLKKAGVSVNGKIVLARYFHGYRGGKSLVAETNGAAGVIVYSDPAEDGRRKGRTYPRGPWGPIGHFQRGSDVYDFEVPGDPLTPGWASVESARRLAAADATSLPKIPMVPLSARDASQILKHLSGPRAPKEWQGGLPFAYRLGGEAAKVHLALRMENRVTPIWNIIGKISGGEDSTKLVILSNHHDAWVYGAVDPSSGTATLLETARALGQLLREGFHARRTILLASWDAEEYTLTGSTEWGEQFEEELRRGAVVCLNVDASTSGENFTLSTVPSLLPAVVEATQTVRDPLTGKSIYDRWRARRPPGNIRDYAVAGALHGPVPYGLLGGGSDYMVFLQHLGIPSLDMIFDGPYGVYHSIYDDFAWMERFGDPGFRYHAAMSRLWGLLALRFSNADFLPLDYSVYATEVAAYLAALENIAPAEFFRAEIRPLIEECNYWRTEAAKMMRRLNACQEGDCGDLPLTKINEGLMAQERALTDMRGLPGRAWFRHLVYAPLPSYDAETLPGLREGLEAGNLGRAREEAHRLGRALERATEALREILMTWKAAAGV